MGANDARGAASWDLDAEIRSESVLLSCVSADARWGVFTRLCRYPSADTAWVWVHVATPDGAWTYANDQVPCGSEPLDVDADDVRYSAGPGIEGAWEREGPRGTPARAAAQLTVDAHRGTAALVGAGPERVDLGMRFRPAYAAGATLKGRSEALGQADVRVRVGEVEEHFTGAGQWHEQVQSAPRFRAPFTYVSLVGDDLALIGLHGPRRSGGFVRGAAGDHLVVGVEVDEPDDDGHHALRIEQEDGAVLEGSVDVVHAYELPLYGRRWRGTFVTADVAGHALSGYVNRWRPDSPSIDAGVGEEA